MAYKRKIMNLSWLLVGLLFHISNTQGIKQLHSRVHLHMNRRELQRYFGVLSHHQVPEYDITMPVQLDDSGEFLSHELGSNTRKKRSENQHFVPQQAYYKLTAFKKTMNLNITKNKGLLGPNFRIEYIGKNGKVIKTTKSKRCYYHGNVNNHRRTRVALSNCDGLSGMIQDGHDTYFMEPLPNRLHNKVQSNGPGRPHIIYKRSLHSHNDHRHVQGHAHHGRSCGTKDDPQIRYDRALEADMVSGRDVGVNDTDKYMETLVVVDPKMCKFHGEDAVKQYALSACNIASSLLRDDSIGPYPVNYVVSKMQILTEPQDGLVINHHGINTLNNFGHWAQKNTNPDDNDPNHFDHASLFTRYNICSDKNQPCDTVGLAQVGGMCRFPASVTVNQDTGLSLGHTLAHETGHNLGMNHDIVGCKNGENIMATSPSGKPSSFEWSKCSQNFLLQFLKTGQANCLNDEPTKKNVLPLSSLDKPGLLYDADEQCKLAFGAKSSFCPNYIDRVCAQLWCSSTALQCHTYFNAAVEGTRCGEKMWCKRGRCVQYGTEGPDAVDGGWSDWSQTYSQCTRTCGGGVQYRVRRCDKPKPLHGGKGCYGKHREHRLCNASPCASNALTFLQHQCKVKDTELFNDQYYKWDWKPSNVKECQLGCFIAKTNKGYAFGNVVDGTDCAVQGKCVAGICKTVGCDNVIDSTSRYDRCGVCNGDGSTCGLGTSFPPSPSKVVAGSTRSNGALIKSALNWLRKMGYNVDRRGRVRTHLRDDIPSTTSDFYWAMTRSGCSVSCGGGQELVDFQCRRSDDGSPVSDSKCDVKLRPAHEERRCALVPCPPTWKPEGWEDCSRTCNGGTRVRNVKCIQSTGDGVEYDLSDSECTKTKPVTSEQCNQFPCDAEWVAMPFGPCSTSCGHGKQTREVVCQRPGEDGSTLTIAPSECSNMKRPSKQEACNVHNPCAGEGGCGGYLSTEVSDTGVVTSPNYPLPYPNDKECVTRIVAKPGQTIKLTFNELFLDSSEDDETHCRGDFVKVMDGDCSMYRASSKFCASNSSASFLTTGNKMCIKFFSDQSQEGKGFRATYLATNKTLDSPDKCGAILKEPAGLITSPNFPEPYPYNEVCNVTINTKESPISLTFQSFNVGTDRCDNDYVILSGGQTEKRLCGNKLPTSYNTTGNILKVSFKSGPKTGRPRPGFVASYTAGSQPDMSVVPQANVAKNTIAHLDQGNNFEITKKDHFPVNPDAVSSVQFLPMANEDKVDASKEEIIDDSDASSKDTGLENALAQLSQALDENSGMMSNNGSSEEKPSGESDSLNKTIGEDNGGASGGTILGESNGGASGNTTDGEGASGNTINHDAVNTTASGSGEDEGNQEEGSSSSSSVKSVIASVPKENFSKSNVTSSKSVIADDERDMDEIGESEVASVTKNIKVSPKTGLSKKFLILPGTSVLSQGKCPSVHRLNCLNLLYAYPCNIEDDCLEKGMTCCPTQCPYGPRMCIPRASRICPIRTPYYESYKMCRDSKDCGRGAVCCLDMAGRHYCRQISAID